jgi:hypothetical protein
MESVVDETFADQFKTKECQLSFKRAALSKEDISKIVETRHPKCKNRKTQSGLDVGLFSPGDLIEYQESGETWCYAPGDRIYKYVYDTKQMEFVNPFTGKIIPRDRGLEMDPKLRKRVPLLTEYIYPVCPIFRSTDPLVRFVTESVRGDYVTNGNAMATDPSPIYRGVLKKEWLTIPNMFGELGKDYGIYDAAQFQELKQVYDPTPEFKGLTRNRAIPYTGYYSLGVKSDTDLSRYFTVPTYRGLNMFQAVKAYMSYSDFYISRPLADDLKREKIRLDTPVKVYRGLRLQSDEPIWDTLDVGEIVKLEDIYPASSWTTDVCIAAGFASSGVVVSYLAQPDEVVLDTRLLKPEVVQDLYKTIQSEVMLDQRKRKVKVKLILRSQQPVYHYSYKD